VEYFQAGLDFAARYGLARHPMTDSLRAAMGRALFIQARCLDLLATEALTRPPIPPEAGPEQRKAYQEKIETEGYKLQDLAVARFQLLVEKVSKGNAPVEWGRRAFARLYQIEPDQWSRAGEVDTVLEVVSGKDWSALPSLPGGAWPEASSPEWRKVRKGVVPPLAFPDHVKSPFRFMWCGDKGIGPRVDTVASTYIPWKQVWAQTAVTLPPNIQGMDLEVVGAPEWAVLLDADTVLTHKALAALAKPWHQGVARDVYPSLSKRLARSARGEAHLLRLWAQNQKPDQGFGIWLRLRIRYKLAGSGPVYPWNQETPSADELKQSLEFPLQIPNFTGTGDAP
jgi:hypothetical protein